MSRIIARFTEKNIFPRTLALLAAWFLTQCVGPAQTTWYVATNGLDTADGTNGWPSALRTISNAVFKAADDNNDVILVAGGVYPLTATIHINKKITLVGVDGRTNTVIDGNFPGYRQRALVVGWSNTVVSGFTITNCVIDYTYGGGVLASNGAWLVDCIISGCSADTYGGGLAIEGYGVIVSNCVIRGNTATNGYGGGVSILSGLLTHCIVEDNTASNNSGGGITKRSSLLTIIENCHVLNNTTDGSGGGINARTNTFIRNCVVYGNKAYGSQGGGGIYIYEGAGPNGGVYNSLIYNNYSSTNGGGVRIRNSGIVSSCTIVSNRADGEGGGLYSDAGGAFVINTISYSNSALTSGSRNIRRTSNSGTVISNCCTIPAFGTDCVTNYPLFIDPDPANPNYRLQSGSPCVNLGLVEDWMPAAVDLDGRTRVDQFSGRVDIGAYEFLLEGSLMRIR